MSTQTSCSCIKIVYKIYGKEGESIEETLSVTKEYGTYNGRYFYNFKLPISTTAIFRIRWNGTKWVFLRNTTTWGELVNDSACPLGDYVLISTGAELFEYFRVEECVTIPEDPEVQCFKLLVWKKQCEYSKCVLRYLKQLQFGNVDCELLDLLKNKRRVLKILNCYDTRDIANNTTEYNTFTYDEIKKLLEY